MLCLLHLLGLLGGDLLRLLGGTPLARKGQRYPRPAWREPADFAAESAARLQGKRQVRSAGLLCLHRRWLRQRLGWLLWEWWCKGLLLEVRKLLR